jgi:hypothetical protein
MSTDIRISTALATVIAGVEVPAVPLRDIRLRMAKPAGPALSLRAPSYFRPFALAAAGVALVLLIAFPASSLEVARIVVSGYQQAFKVIGWTPPPAEPQTLASSSRPVLQPSLPAAQAHVTFAIVSPAGLPSDVTTTKIFTAPAHVYSYATRSWHIGAAAVNFVYKRSGGRSFVLLADAYDPKGEIPSRYMFSSEDLPGGRVALVKHEQFAWRNGDQVLTAIEGDGISASEIRVIEKAMNGVPIAESSAASPHREHVVKRFIPGPQ